MNLPDYALAVVNTTREARQQLTVTSRVISLEGRILATREDHLNAAANQVSTLAPLDLAPYLAHEGVVLVALALTDSTGQRLSENIYWPSLDESSTQALNALKPQNVRVSAHAAIDADEITVHVSLEDTGPAPALAAKLTLIDDTGARILPAFYSDNYVSLLPGEPRQIEIRYPRTHTGEAHLNLRGWNIEPLSTNIELTP